MNENNEKPKICELLGVDVGEEFSFNYPNKYYGTAWIDEDGTLCAKNQFGNTNKCGGAAVCWLINHPKSVKNKPKLTETELNICDMFGATEISRMSSWVYLYDNDNNTLAQISCKFFPSVETFETITLGEETDK